MTDWGRHRSIFRGIVRLVQFNSEGLLDFGDTPQAFVNSLAPLLAFPLVGAGVTLYGGAHHGAIVNMLASVIAVAAPPVLSHILASLWHREPLWTRYAIAFNWCEAAVFLTMVVLLVVTSRRGVMAHAAWTLPVYLYWAVLNGFLAKRALRISVLRAVVMVVFVNFGSFLLMARSISSMLYWPVAALTKGSSWHRRSRISRGAPFSDINPERMTLESRKMLIPFLAILLPVQHVSLLFQLRQKFRLRKT